MQATYQKSHSLMAWIVCGLGALFYTYEYLLRITPSVMEPALRAHFNLTATSFGIMASMYYYAYVPMQLPVGVLLDRYGPRILLSLACLICVIGTFLFGATDQVWIATIGRFLVGFGSAFAFVGVLKLATIWLPEDKIAMVAGMTSALGPIGAMLGDNFMGKLVFNAGWLRTVEISAIVGIFLTIILWYGIKDINKDSPTINAIHDFKRSMIDLCKILKNKQIWINGLFGCLVYLPTTVLAELWGIPYLKAAHNLTHESADFIGSLLFLGFTIGAPLMGLISDKIKQRKPPMIIGATGAAIVMMIILYMPGLTTAHLEVLMFLLGLLYSSQCIVFAVARELSPSEAAGTAIAATNMIVMLGAMVCQPIVGKLLDFSLHMHTNVDGVINASVDKLQQTYTANDYQFALSIIPIGIIISALLAIFLKETHADLSE